MSDKEIHKICKKYKIKNYTISDGVVDVDGYVDFFGNRLSKLPLKFGVVKYWFNCSFNKLTSLEGAPREVGGYFDCSFNQLTSLKGAPLKVSRFCCSNNPKELSYEKYLLKMTRLNKLKEI